MFKSLKERTIDDNLLLEGITSSGHRITFINIKLIRQSGGIYKAFVPAYIIGNSNMTNPLPKIDNFETMIFYGKCIDNFFDPQKVIELGNEDVNEINMKLKALKNDDILIEKDKFKIAHGNMKNEILFSDMDVVVYVIVERLVQCLIFYKANVDMNKIKEIVDDRF